MKKLCRMQNLPSPMQRATERIILILKNNTDSKKWIPLTTGICKIKYHMNFLFIVQTTLCYVAVEVMSLLMTNMDLSQSNSHHPILSSPFSLYLQIRPAENLPNHFPPLLLHRHTGLPLSLSECDTGYKSQWIFLFS